MGTLTKAADTDAKYRINLLNLAPYFYYGFSVF